MVSDVNHGILSWREPWCENPRNFPADLVIFVICANCASARPGGFDCDVIESQIHNIGSGSEEVTVDGTTRSSIVDPVRGVSQY